MRKKRKSIIKYQQTLALKQTNKTKQKEDLNQAQLNNMIILIHFPSEIIF